MLFQKLRISRKIINRLRMSDNHVAARQRGAIRKLSTIELWRLEQMWEVMNWEVTLFET